MSSTSQIFKPFKLIVKSRKNLLLMLQNRGYNVDKFLNFTENEITSMLKSHNNGKYETKSEIGPLDILLEKTNESAKKEKIYVKYRLDDKFKTTENLKFQINEIYANILDKNDTLIILNIARIVSKPGVKDKTDDEFVKSYYLTKGYYMQIFGLENFIFNVSNHSSVPKHIALNKNETIEMAKKYNITNLRNLPLIKRSEPQAKYIGLKPKQVCKILKKNKTSGETTEFRICTN